MREASVNGRAAWGDHLVFGLEIGFQCSGETKDGFLIVRFNINVKNLPIEAFLINSFISSLGGMI